MTRLDLRHVGGWLHFAGAVGILALALACGGAQQRAADVAQVEAAAAGESASVLAVHDARLQLMPNMGSLYLVVDNPLPQPDRLLRVETDLSAAAETHETINEEGVLRMRPRPEGFEVPAAGRLVLEPGGKHVMLMAPSMPAGDTVQVVLYFEHAGAVEVTATVSGAAGAAGGDAAMDHQPKEPHGGH
jgi:copper(I)-binding protein